jgi:hypothetical protein
MKYLLFVIFIALPIKATYEPYKKDNIGEYYEYDLEGSAHKKARKKARYRSKKIASSFYTKSHRVKKSRHKLRKISTLLENYLSNTHKQNIHKTLNNWHQMLDLNLVNYQRRHHSSPGPLYIVRESWRLLKYSLYIAGFRLPRAVKKTLKNMLYGSFGFSAYRS